MQPTPTPVTPSSSGSNTSGGSSGSHTGSNTGGSGGSSPPSQPSSTPSYTSTNWSGYLATTGKFTTVSASWIVPTVTGNGSTVSADATWIGIGGVTSGDLIQIGTEDSVDPDGQVSTAGFYEMLPAVSQTIRGVTVVPGDSITASISEPSADNWFMTLTDNTNHQTFSEDVVYDSLETSAEWIEEDPSYVNGQLVPLDNFGSVYFTGCLSTDNGTSVNLTASNASSVTLVNESGGTIGMPSSIGGDGGSFSVTHL